MNKYFIILFGLTFLFFGSSTWACREVNWTPLERAENSADVYVVRILGVEVPRLEELPFDAESMKVVVSTSRMNKVVSVKVYESLKGSNPNPQKIDINWCGGGKVEIGHVGILFRLGNDWHIELGAKVVSLVKSALTKQSI